MKTDNSSSERVKELRYLSKT